MPTFFPAFCSRTRNVWSFHKPYHQQATSKTPITTDKTCIANVWNFFLAFTNVIAVKWSRSCVFWCLLVEMLNQHGHWFIRKMGSLASDVLIIPYQHIRDNYIFSAWDSFLHFPHLNVFPVGILCFSCGLQLQPDARLGNVRNITWWRISDSQSFYQNNKDTLTQCNERPPPLGVPHDNDDGDMTP